MKEEYLQSLDMRIELFEKLKSGPGISQICELISCALAKGNKVLAFGNGGSATQASHFAAELVNRYRIDRKGLPAVSLAADTANLTSIANDSDFKYIFSRQVEALGEPGDVALGITTSGKSPNVLAALKKAGEMGLDSIALCGEDDSALEQAGTDISFKVPSKNTPLVQEIHLFILHAIAGEVEKRLFSAPGNQGA